VASEPAGEGERLRRTFGQVAEQYDRVRPGYPALLFDDLAHQADLRPGARVLEIGCGTGQATRVLAERGYTVTALDLSPAMIDVARARLAAFGNVDLQVSAFEAWPLPPEPFDLVCAAQALHWVRADVRWPKIAAALAPRGWAAVFGHEHVAGGTRPFFEQVQACYERWMPGTPPGLRQTPAERLPFGDQGLAASDLFEPPTLRRYPWQQAYTTAEYLAVLGTYSGHIDLPEPGRAGLLECIASLIDSGYGGRIEKAYVTDLVLARKRT
jgi:SAM-dependent methyltransferase